MSYRPVVVDRKTALEDDILGQFERLNSELTLIDSEQTKHALAEQDPIRRRVLQAMLDRELNLAEVGRLYRQDAVREAPTGLLEPHNTSSNTPEGERMSALIARENAARMTIMRGLIDLTRDLTTKDLPAVQRVFFRLNLQLARSVREASGRQTE